MPYPDTKSVVIISSTPYHFTWQSIHSLSEQFARRGWRVMFVEPPPKRFPGLRELRRVWGRLRGNPVQSGISPQREIPGVRIVLPLTLPDRGRLLRWVNRRWLLPRLARQIRSDGEPVPLLVSFLPTQGVLDLLNLLQPQASVYFCMLNFPHDPLSPRDIAQTEAALAQRVDLVFVDQGVDNQARFAALPLTRRPLTYTATVNYDLFAPARQPRPPQDPPVCCYFGDVRANVDLDLLEMVSARCPLQVIGSNTDRITWQHPNLRLTGLVPHDRLPALLAEIDIILLPYRQDDPYNRGVFPAKVYESLATGKPVVAIGLPSVEPLGDVIDLAASRAEFLSLIERAHQRERTPAGVERRDRALAIAQAADISVSYDRLFAAIDALVAADGTSAGAARR